METWQQMQTLYRRTTVCAVIIFQQVADFRLVGLQSVGHDGGIGDGGLRRCHGEPQGSARL